VLLDGRHPARQVEARRLEQRERPHEGRLELSGQHCSVGSVRVRHHVPTARGSQLGEDASGVPAGVIAATRARQEVPAGSDFRCLLRPGVSTGRSGSMYEHHLQVHPANGASRVPMAR
jgi:hypothetical protein